MRKIIATYDAPDQHWVGDGFPVRNLLSHAKQGTHISPFVLLDYAEPTQFDPAQTPRGVGQHPHKGFETVTIVYQGELEHRDSTGAGGVIGPGDVQWMTAGSGILHQEFHSEAFTQAGGTLEMVQLWVNLPAQNKGAKPNYQDIRDNDIPRIALPNDAGVLRLIAGQFGKRQGAAHTFTPLNIWDVRLARDKTIELDIPEGHTASVLVLSGTIEINGQTIARSGQTVVCERGGGGVRIESNTEAKLLVLTGEPIDEPMVVHGPFVMNTMGEIKHAMRDFQAGKFGRIAEKEDV